MLWARAESSIMMFHQDAYQNLIYQLFFARSSPCFKEL